MIVSLEAIFLALFVLASQNRLAKQSDLRANLDLQIDLLVEREMTAVLQLLHESSPIVGQSAVCSMCPFEHQSFVDLADSTAIVPLGATSALVSEIMSNHGAD